VGHWSATPKLIDATCTPLSAASVNDWAARNIVPWALVAPLKDAITTGQCQQAPATPSPLFGAAATIPEVWVPWTAVC
jgi:hypothetical protein